MPRESTPVLSDVLAEAEAQQEQARRRPRLKSKRERQAQSRALQAVLKRKRGQTSSVRRRLVALPRAPASASAPQPAQSPVCASDAEPASVVDPGAQEPDQATVRSEMDDEDGGDAPAVRHATYVSAAAAPKRAAPTRIEWPGLPGPSSEQPSGAGATEQPSELAALRAELEELRAKVATTEAATSSNPRASVSGVRVSPKDVQLDKFSGNRDADAHVIAKDQFLPFLEWLQACEFTLATSRLPSEFHVPVLISHLTGAAKKAFLRRFDSTAVAVKDWSLNDAKLAIASLVPNHKVLFTKTAFRMQFSARSLENDLQRFALYMRIGELPEDNSQYVFDTVQEKMQDAVPDIFSLATSLYNKRFEFKPTFDEIMHDAIDIVSTLQVHGKLNAKRSRPEHDSDPSRNPKQTRPQAPERPGGGPQGRRGDNRRGPPPGAAGAKKTEFMQLAKRFNRCYGCGRHVISAELDAHKAMCKKDPGAFAKRMGQVKRLVDAGRDKEVNVFPPPPTKDQGGNQGGAQA